MPDIVQYIVVNSELNMSPGKIGAQCGHAVQLMCFKYFEVKNKLPIWPPGGESFNRVKLVEEWITNDYAKIVKKAKGNKFQKMKEIGGEFVVVDIGRTELVGQNETVIAFWPMPKDKCPKELYKLQLL